MDSHQQTATGRVRAMHWIAILLLSACSSASEPVEQPIVRIEPTAAAYAPGDSVWIALRNIGVRGVAYPSLWCGHLERADGERWSRVTYARANCPDVGYSLAPGVTVVGLADVLPRDLPPGQYRYAFSGIEAGDLSAELARSEQVSAAFRVVIAEQQTRE